jgi:CubicO group peptidase (beta-lactamase class C family)
VASLGGSPAQRARSAPQPPLHRYTDAVDPLGEGFLGGHHRAGPVVAVGSGSRGFDTPFAVDGARPALGMGDFPSTNMVRLFARRQDLRSSLKLWTGSAPRRASDRSRRVVRRRAWPEVEALDARLLMDSGHAGAADAMTSSDLADRVAEVLEPYFARDQFPGISVAIVKHGRVVLAQGYGISDVATGSPVQADTRFDIGSVTKTFTAVGVLLLYQESQGTSHPLDLNAPISDYLHNTKSFRLPRKWSHVTTMELLNMTSGIREVGGPRPWQAKLNSIAKAPLLYTPGTKTSYSNANYDLLGQLIEQWTGEKYDTFIHDHILGPIGMSQTQELGNSATVPNQAVGYDAPRHGRWPKARLQNGPALYAAAGMVSTAQDMATYMTALLSGRLLDPASDALMWASKPTLQYGVKPPANAMRGLGWDTVIHTTAGRTIVNKSGQVPGYTSELILHPSSESGVFVSFNTNYHGSRNPNGTTALEVAESVYKVTKTRLPR